MNLGFTDLSQDIGVANVEVQPENVGRAYLLIQNLTPLADTAVIWVRFGEAAVPDTAGCVMLGPGASLIFEDGFQPTGSINIISDTADTPVTVWVG